MSSLVDIALRLIGLLSAYVLAALSASLFLHLLAYPVFASLLAAEPGLAGGLFVSVPLVTMFVLYFAFAPASLLIGVAELLRLRGMVLHLLGGGACGFLALVLYWRADGRDFDELAFTYTPEAIAGVVAAGIAAGFVYWVVAGRRAGYWLDRARSIASGRADSRTTAPER